jgi:uncharacterized LabA/DUF88 family protein
MKAIIFNDKENSDRSLNRLNRARDNSHQRFWEIKLFHAHILHIVKELLKNKVHCVELVKALIYTGEYNARALNNVKKSCGDRIREMNELIKKENQLLQKVSEMRGNDGIKREITDHVKSVKSVFETIKNDAYNAIQKQNKNAEGQIKFFSYVRGDLPFSELRTSPLVTRKGVVQQKGVDAKFATDLILLAQANAFDIAILLTGDADLKEAIKLIRERYGKLVFMVAYKSPNSDEGRFNTISEDMINECDYFINLYLFSEEDILKISRDKTTEVEIKGDKLVIEKD